MEEEQERRKQKRDGRGVRKEGAEERWKRSRKGGSRREMEED